MTNGSYSPAGPLEDRADALGLTDRLSVRDYVTSTEIGAFEQERGVEQRLKFNVVVALTAPTDVENDDVDQILSYDRITDAIEAELSAARFNLLETLAEQLATRILREARALKVFIRIEKLDRGSGDLGVEILREGSGEAVSDLLPRAEIVILDPEETLPDTTPLVICPASAPAEHSALGEEARLRIALLALEQAAWAFADAHRDLSVVSSRTELEWHIRQSKQCIWAPGKMVLDTPGAPESADPVTLVRWLQSQMA